MDWRPGCGPWRIERNFVTRALSSAPSCLWHQACSWRCVSQEQESSASTRQVFVPITKRKAAMPSPAQSPPSFSHSSSLFHLLTSLLPHSSLLLPSPSRPSDCRPSFTDNLKAQPLLAHHSLFFTSLAGVDVIPVPPSLRLALFTSRHCPALIVPSDFAESTIP